MLTSALWVDYMAVQVVAPTSSVQVVDIIETATSFVAALESPLGSDATAADTIELQFRKLSNKRETPSDVITINISVTAGRYLIVISKEDLRNKLDMGTSYAIEVSLNYDCHTS